MFTIKGGAVVAEVEDDPDLVIAIGLPLSIEKWPGTTRDLPETAIDLKETARDSKRHQETARVLLETARDPVVVG